MTLLTRNRKNLILAPTVCPPRCEEYELSAPKTETQIEPEAPDEVAPVDQGMHGAPYKTQAGRIVRPTYLN